MNIKEILTSQIEPSNIEGLSIEMKDFFSNESFLQNVKLKYSTNKNTYIISCTTKTPNPVVAKDIFMRFVNFIQYSKFTFYTQKKTKQKIEYELISGSEDMTCFCCKVIFSQD